jgi:hypothetical protein
MATDLAAQAEALNKQLAANSVQLNGQLSASTTQPSTPAPGKSWWRADEAMTISSIVLAFGVFVLLLSTWLLRKTEVTADAVLRIFGTILIIIGALFLVVAGYTDVQMGPVMGLLGTIAGYLLGKSGTPPAPGKPEKSDEAADKG